MAQYLADGTVLDGRYEIQEELGEGGTSLTYLAYDLRIGKRVAIKEYFDQSYMTRFTDSSVKPMSLENSGRLQRELEDFFREAKTQAELTSIPGLVDVYDCFKANGTIYIVMEAIPSDLKKYLDKHLKISEDILIPEIFPLMETISELHRRDILHRDISPENIGLKSKENTMEPVVSLPLNKLKFILMDFGSAGKYEDTKSSRVKHGYAAPEQYKKDMKTGPWTDVYGLCCTLYKCLTDKTPQNALYRMLYDELERPSKLGIKIDPRLEDILMKGLAVEPENRYQSVSELESALKELYSEEAVKRIEVRRKRKKTVIAVSACLFAVCVAVGTAVYAWKHREEIYFRGEETEEFFLYPGNDMSLSEFFEASDVIRERIKLFSEGRFLWDEQRDVIRVVLPYKYMNGEDEERTIKKYLTDPWKMTLMFGHGDGVLGSYPVSTEMNDIEIIHKTFEENGVETEGDFLRITADPEQTDYWKDFFYGREPSVRGGGIIKDFTDIFDTSRRTYYVSDVQDGVFDAGPIPEEKNLQAVIANNIMSPPLKTNIESVCDVHVEYETPVENAIEGEFGVYQVPEEKISGERVLLLYSNDRDKDILDRLSDPVLQRADYMEHSAEIKKNLDELKKPYAIGIAKCSNDKIAVIIGKDDITGLEAELAGGFNQWLLYWENGSIDITYYNLGYPSGEDDNKLTFEETSDGMILMKSKHLSEVPRETRVFLKVTPHLLSDYTGNVVIGSGYATDDGVLLDTFYYPEWKESRRLRKETINLLNRVSLNEGGQSKHLWFFKSIYYDEDGSLNRYQREKAEKKKWKADEFERLIQYGEITNAKIEWVNKTKLSLIYDDIGADSFFETVCDYLPNIFESAPDDGLLEELSVTFNDADRFNSLIIEACFAGKNSGNATVRGIIPEAMFNDIEKSILEIDTSGGKALNWEIYAKTHEAWDESIKKKKEMAKKSTSSINGF